MLNIHRFKLDKNAKKLNEKQHILQKETHVLTRVTWFSVRERNGEILKPHRSTSTRTKWAAKFTQTFFASASKLPDFTSFYVCVSRGLTRQAWIESHAGCVHKKYRNKAATSCASLNVFIYRREIKVWFHGSQTSGSRF